MTEIFVFNLFPSYFKTTPVADNTIEIFDFHECEYGKIFYKGQLIFSFDGENYYDKLHTKKTQNKFIKAGLDLKKAQALKYDFHYIRRSGVLFANFDISRDYDDYNKLFNDLQSDLSVIQPINTAGEIYLDNLNPTIKGKNGFVKFQELEF